MSDIQFQISISNSMESFDNGRAAMITFESKFLIAISLLIVLLAFYIQELKSELLLQSFID